MRLPKPIRYSFYIIHLLNKIIYFKILLIGQTLFNKILDMLIAGEDEI